MDDVKRPSTNPAGPTEGNDVATAAPSGSTGISIPVTTEPVVEKPASNPDVISLNADNALPPEQPSAASPSSEPESPIQSPDASNASPQKGAGLDLSSLSEEDAKDLGVPVPTQPGAPSDVVTPNMSMAKPPKKSSKTIVIIVAVLVALALIAGAGYAYYSTSQKNKKTTSSTPAATQPTDKTTNEVKSADIDSTSTALDASLKKVDDTKDFTANDLSDATLGIQ